MSNFTDTLASNKNMQARQLRERKKKRKGGRKTINNAPTTDDFITTIWVHYVTDLSCWHFGIYDYNV